jgi:acyl dehydratase
MTDLLLIARLTSQIGQRHEPSPWFVVEQARIDAFADATLDHQFIHVDPSRAAKTAFGTTIAHGFLILSLLNHLGSQPGVEVPGAAMHLNYGLNKVRFVNPVRVGSEIRVIRSLRRVEERQPGQILLTHEFTVEINGDSKPAMLAEWLELVVLSP